MANWFQQTTIQKILPPCIFKAGEEYIIKFFGIHKNCDKTDNSNLNTLEPQITIIKVSDDVETSKVTTVPATTIPVTTTTIATTAEVPQPEMEKQVVK